MKQHFFTSKRDSKRSSLLFLSFNESYTIADNMQTDLFVVQGQIIKNSVPLEEGSYSSFSQGTISNRSKIDAILFLYEETKQNDYLEILVKPSDYMWQKNSISGLMQTLLRSINHHLHFVVFEKGTEVPFHTHIKGEEIFILKGELWDEQTCIKEREWLRIPPKNGHAPYVKQKTLALIRNGHL